FLLALRQHLFVHNLVVRRHGVLVLLVQLLGVGQLDQDFAAARPGVRVGVGEVLGALGRLAKAVLGRFQRLIVGRRIVGVGGPDLGLGDPQQALVGQARLLVHQRLQRLL